MNISNKICMIYLSTKYVFLFHKRSKIRRSAHRENAGLFQQGKQQKRDRPRRFGA